MNTTQQNAGETVFNAIAELFMANTDEGYRTFVNQGGTSSAKTYTLLQVLLYHAIKEKGSVCTVVGQDLPNLKVGALRDMKTITGGSEWMQRFVKFNDSTSTMTMINGSIIEFKSYANAQDAKSGKRDYLFVNEANGITYDIYWQLAIRTRKRIWIDYNPSARFWVHDEIIGREGVKLIISDHRGNCFLTDEEHERIENISDKELWKVYARGYTGMVQGLVFTNWDIVDELPPMEEWKMSCRGLDFGFTCFKGDTLIMTSKGEVAIKDVKAGDYVLTRDGYHQVRRNIFNGVKKVVHRRFENGQYEMDMYCTYEHLFNTNGKWKQYGELTKEDKLCILSSSMAWCIGDTQTGNTQTIITTSGKKTGNTKQRFFIMPSMKQNTGKYLTVWSFIMWIATLLITMSKTFLQSQHHSIQKYMTNFLNGTKSIKKRLKSVFIQKKTGIKGERKYWINWQKKRAFANIAEANTHQQTHTKGFVANDAITNGSIRQKKTILKWCAKIAEKCLKEINILNRNVVAINAHMNYLCLSGLETSGCEICEVYDLEIEGVHEYFANGVLVHNCDPSALEHVVLAHGELWIDEEVYSTGLTNPLLAQKAKDAGVTGEHEIIADCAEPKSIAELRGEGLWVTPSAKGKDSIVVGLDILRRYKIHITRRSLGILDNFRRYSWSKDREGNMTNKPEDRNNHGVDAIRYVALRKLNIMPRARGITRRN